MTNTLERSLSHDKLAPQFDTLMNQYDINRRLEVLIDDFLKDIDLKGLCVLDAGCGTGRASARLRNRGANVVAIDIGLNLAKLTRERCPCIPTVGSVATTPFPDHTFDVVFSTEVIEHTPFPLDSVDELCRVLKSGGHLILSTPNSAWHWSVVLANRLGMRPYEGFENFISPRALANQLKANNMKIIRHTGIHIAPFQIRFIHPFLRWADQWGDYLLSIMINQCIHAIKQ